MVNLYVAGNLTSERRKQSCLPISTVHVLTWNVVNNSNDNNRI